MKKFVVTADVTYSCKRTIEALDEDDALEQCRGVGPDEWVQGFEVYHAHVDLEDAHELKKGSTSNG